MVRAVYPGSFDPITFGHVDIIRRIVPLFDEVIVLVAQSEQKQYFFETTQRIELVKACLEPSPRLRVDSFSGLTVEYARREKASVIVRGLRAVSDYEYELAMAHLNRRMAPEIETMIVFARPEYFCVSSRMVKEVAVNGGSIEDLVPLPVAQVMKAYLSQ